VWFGTVKEGSNGNAGHVPVWVRARDVFDQYTFVKTDEKSRRPQTARVYHFDGKLIMRGLANKGFCFVRGEVRDLQAVVETIDSDWVVVKNSKTVPENANPIAQIEFPGRTSGRNPIVEVPLARRC